MIGNLLIRTSAAGLLATATASSASAKLHADVNLGLAAPGFAYGEQGNRVKEQTPNPILELDHLGLA